MPSSAQAVLAFWFADETAPRWFVRDEGFDTEIRERFGAVAEAAAAGRLDDWAATPQGWLALLIVLDQFSRNLYRQDARAWAQDARALALARAGIARGDDQQLPLLQRVFAYMPLEHAESVAAQDQCVALFAALHDVAPEAQRETFEMYVDYARRHQDVVARFGRFPHRNAVLGRTSTPAELAYLAEPGAGF